MSVNEKIDESLDTILRASGSALKNYTMQKSLDNMRNAMRKIMSDAYIKGSNDCFETMVKGKINHE